jgi:hypothetical protein
VASQLSPCPQPLMGPRTPSCKAQSDGHFLLEPKQLLVLSVLLGALSLFVVSGETEAPTLGS